MVAAKLLAGPTLAGCVSFLHRHALVELGVVAAVLLLALYRALPRPGFDLTRREEEALRAELARMRAAIGRHVRDTGHFPASLEALVARRYLPEIPCDPLTQRATSWIVVVAADPEQGGIAEVRSGAPGRSRDGSRYRDW